ncbi:allantoinase AllB [Mycobacterium sp. PSTR-4-N]|uniref:allantoinase AllB n=1 Tax=Mycobacterium sp. PSTR-4-N TaxID=2917745 RepID=UPI001F156794|nr:allantoinase AllB [Mycobacterium sp. PSTR-4-N]MCG7593844.1 allantoinase AllB [Mycobacterium sp. PSTR-4-N]
MIDLVLRADRALIGGTLRPAAVAVARGFIVGVGARDTAYDARADVTVPESAVLLPGFVDTHVHVSEPGPDWEGFATATETAARAGITTLVDMPLDSLPVTTTVAALEAKREVAQGRCEVAVAYWGGVVPDNLGMLGSLADAGVRGFKCFLADSGNPHFGHLTPEQFTAAGREIADLGSVLLVHAEDHDVLAGCGPASGRSYRSFLASRPAAAEAGAVELAVAVARDTGAHIHIVHVSSAQAVGILAAAKAAGVCVTAETCPHYLTFTADEIPAGATQFAACPPIRSGDDRDALWAALVDGTLDMVVSDHSPCAPDLKGAGDFGAAFGGISSLQVSPRAVWTEAVRRGVGLTELSQWMSERPARLAGWTDRGAITHGARADLCAFDPDATEAVTAAELRHRHPLTPYDGMMLRGRVLATWVAGRQVYDATGVAA